MSGPLSKRQQARNERILHDLIKNVPGNNQCADCQAQNPGKLFTHAEKLGIFLCMRCAALHRKLGTHITKVKSLSMDSWSYEQVETMKKIGNIASNRIYNPQNIKASIPFDADADSAMEKFIRQKYQTKNVKVQLKHDSSTAELHEQPPPPPPKHGNRFGFRSASSIFPLSLKHKKEVSQQHGVAVSRAKSPTLQKNKPSRVFGVSLEGDNDYESKNIKLCGMGFTDQKRNLAVLKGLGGDLEKSIETLVCLGDNGNRHEEQIGFNLTTLGSPAQFSSNSNNCSPISRNPFDMLNPSTPTAQPQSSQSTGGLHAQHGTNPYQQPHNFKQPGSRPSQSQLNLDQTLQKMSINQSQPLFPNRTGPGFPSPIQSQQNIYQQSMTPPVPSLPLQYFPTSLPLNNPELQQQQTLAFNPFSQVSQQTLVNTNSLSNPFIRQQSAPETYQQSSLIKSYSEIPNSSTLQPYQPTNPYFTHQTVQTNPFFQTQLAPISTHEIPDHAYTSQLPQSQTNPAIPQRFKKADTQSILDLFNHPELAPSRLASSQSSEATTNQDPRRGLANLSHEQPQPSNDNKNPFASTLPNNVSECKGSPQLALQCENQECTSPDVTDWMNGRHSPDAWRSISARSLG
ncbi:UBA domain-containing protein 3 [Blumeria hordei DH14]|uniref:UBA domain-containing protein 3 n=1 Tax=Blumeria graminis f. sp. hordei (strain DH14) TaxID=546991 RepID=N1JFE0_BLUG1|nr:UBA domain-containing protein 3 [Blumeria hordei DH14]